jgi:hypothetical protein
MLSFTKRIALDLCGLAIAIILLSNGASIYAQSECNYVGAPLSTTGDISLSDTAQTSRMFRDGRGTTCLFNRAQTTSAGSYNSDSYTFTNTTGGPICVYVDLDAVGCGVATNQISIAGYLTSYNPASILTNIIADPGLSTGQNFATSMSFSVATGATYVIVVHNVNAGTTCASYTFKRYISNNCRNAGFDAANDGSADLALFRPSGGLATWNTKTLTGSVTTTQLGSAGDTPVAADYTGDETTDVAVFRPGNGTWYTSTNASTNYDAKLWGLSGDVPVQGDYDRDGITDLAVFRPSTNNWYILRSAGNIYQQFAFGAAGDKPVVADFDGDGKTDPAIYTPSTGLWTILSSAGNYGSFVNQLAYGLSTDKPVPADYDGDGKADIAVFRPSEGNWYIFRSSLTAGQSQVLNWGLNGDVPQPADYDGDRKTDLAVFRPSDSTWWVARSTAGIFSAQFGQSGDLPATAPNSVP